MARSPSPPFRLHSIGFAHKSSRDAIPLRRVHHNGFVTSPEWIAGQSNEPVAYVRGARPTIRVVFRRRAGTAGTVTAVVGAKGHGGPSIPARKLRIRFNRQGLSGAYQFALSERLPREIGRLKLRLEWHASLPAREAFLGQTSHEILVAWKHPVNAVVWHSHSEIATARKGLLAGRWAYVPVMRWVCTWAAGKNDHKSICDAIIANVHRSGLKYAVGAWTVRAMLQLKGGYCGGWYRMFQAMAGSQGVGVERRTFLVDWPADTDDQVRWCAIVVENPGINRRNPQDVSSQYHDANTHPLDRCRVHTTTRRRYRFWGSPGKQADGHCINFLKHQGTYYLYDACFFNKGIRLSDFRTPPTSLARPIPVSGLGSFKRAYLDRAVDHMLGSVKAGGNLYRCIVPNPAIPGFHHHKVHNGLTERTGLIRTRERELSFYWRP